MSSRPRSQPAREKVEAISSSKSITSYGLLPAWMAPAIWVMNSLGVPGRVATSTSMPVCPVKSSVSSTSVMESTAQLPTPMVILVCALTCGARPIMAPASPAPVAASKRRRVSSVCVCLCISVPPQGDDSPSNTSSVELVAMCAVWGCGRCTSSTGVDGAVVIQVVAMARGTTQSGSGGVGGFVTPDGLGNLFSSAPTCYA